MLSEAKHQSRRPRVRWLKATIAWDNHLILHFVQDDKRVGIKRGATMMTGGD
jgi:hypothetical protein